MVKKCHMRNSSIRRTLSRSGHVKLHDNGVEARTTKQDGDEDSLESTEVSAKQATESRNEVQKVSEDTFPEAPAEEASQKARNQKRRGRRTNSSESLR